MNKGIIATTLPSYQGHPGLTIAWAQDCRPAFNQGVQAAQAWLAGNRRNWLWAALIFEREEIPAEIQRRAFEVGFLSRLHQGVSLSDET
nr:LasR-specific antiactivator QslA [Pseudomonas sp.]